jgi:DNA-binding transcriptional MerR regulator
MKIGKIAQQVNVSKSIIRYYESMGLLPHAIRDSAGYREYDDDDLARIKLVVNSRRLGFSFEDIREILAMRDLGKAPCQYLLELLEQKASELGSWIDTLRGLGIELSELRDQALSLQINSVENSDCFYHPINN